MTAAGALAPALRDAARVVARVAAGRSLSDELILQQAEHTRRAALLDLTHGTLRRYGRVQAIVAALSRRGTPDELVQALLWCALYALDTGRYADYTVVDQTVRACSLLERWSAKGYVNGVLRTWLRERATARDPHRAAAKSRVISTRNGGSSGCGATIHRNGPQILAAGNAHPPMSLRVNARRSSPQAYLERLAQAGIEAEISGASALLLKRPLPVERLPGFAEGEVSVQDAAAQRAARAAATLGTDSVCSTPARPRAARARISSSAPMSRSPPSTSTPRAASACAATSSGCGSPPSVRSADCTRPQAWWDGVPFERILADVPCSASGVARRHPDIKWLRRAEDVAAFAGRQLAMLEALWQLLAPGGKLLYATCSVFAQENQALVDAFLARAPHARAEPLPAGERNQWLPGPRHDGFFYALIQKTA